MAQVNPSQFISQGNYFPVFEPIFIPINGVRQTLLEC